MFFVRSHTGKVAGFTFVEFLIVGAIIFLMSGLLLPLGFGFFQTQNVDEIREDIITTLRRAQNQAVFQKNDSSFGVKVLAGSYILFQGSSYVARQQLEDEVFTTPPGVTVSGLDEIVFNKLIGTPNNIAIVNITSGNYIRSIDINSQGKIEGL